MTLRTEIVEYDGRKFEIHELSVIGRIALSSDLKFNFVNIAEQCLKPNDFEYLKTINDKELADKIGEALLKVMKLTPDKGDVDPL